MTPEEHKRVIEKNRQLVKRFPFLLPRNIWTGEAPDDYDYSYTDLDAMPNGWRKAFGEQMCEEIANELRRSNFLDKYMVVQIKEKYGTLRWYDNGGTERLYEIIDKYEELSGKTCIRCGAPATKISKGWISPWCDSCAKELENESFWEIDGE